MTENTKLPPSRRNFVKTAGLGVVAAVGAVLSVNDAEAESPSEAEETTGYRESEHVKKYYESTRY